MDGHETGVKDISKYMAVKNIQTKHDDSSVLHHLHLTLNSINFSLKNEILNK